MPMIVVGHAMSIPDVAEAHVGDVVGLLRASKGALSQEDVDCCLEDLERAYQLLARIRDQLPPEAAFCDVEEIEL